MQNKVHENALLYIQYTNNGVKRDTQTENIPGRFVKNDTDSPM